MGEESLEAYEMLYVFKRIDQAWLVDEIHFTAEPQVGRKSTPWSDHRALSHQVANNDQPKEDVKP